MTQLTLGLYQGESPSGRYRQCERVAEADRRPDEARHSAAPEPSGGPPPVASRRGTLY